MIISVINQKGGVGKTTTAISIAAGAAQAGIATLLVDLDPQGNASSGVGADKVPHISLYEALIAHMENNDDYFPQTQQTCMDSLDVLASDQQLAGAEVELAGHPERDHLKAVLAPFVEKYPVIVIDTPPSLSVLTINALVAADHLIIPVQCEYYALEGLSHLLRTLEKVKRQLNPELKVLGILRTMFDGRLGLGGQVSRELERHFPQLVFETLIPRNVRLAEAPSFGKPIFLYDRRSPGAAAYTKLTEEILHRLKINVPKPSKGLLGKR
ncbi:MAG: ParA family protein [Abditibacteriaceae bacterium]